MTDGFLHVEQKVIKIIVYLGGILVKEMLPNLEILFCLGNLCDFKWLLLLCCASEAIKKQCCCSFCFLFFAITERDSGHTPWRNKHFKQIFIAV
jgi:hypothetical protein